MKLIQKQKLFAILVGRLLEDLEHLGYECSLGEAWRPPETAEAYAKDGRGISNSLHTKRLAIDLNLFKDGKFLTRTVDYQKAGEHWESFSQEEFTCVWGGRFGDGNHFSIEHEGVR